MQALSLSEVYANRERAQRDMIEEHAQIMKRYCLELVDLIDSGAYVQEAAEGMYESCRSTDALQSIISEKQRRTVLVNGMRIVTGRAYRK